MRENHSHNVGVRLQVERDEGVEEGPPEQSGHVHGLYRVEELLLVAVLADAVLGLVVGLVAERRVQLQGLEIGKNEGIT